MYVAGLPRFEDWRDTAPDYFSGSSLYLKEFIRLEVSENYLTRSALNRHAIDRTVPDTRMLAPASEHPEKGDVP